MRDLGVHLGGGVPNAPWGKKDNEPLRVSSVLFTVVTFPRALPFIFQRLPSFLSSEIGN